MNDNDANLTKLDELSDDELRDRLHLERKVEQAFWQAGRSLAEIRNRRLYRNTHQNFAEYCRERFGFSRNAAFYKIAAAQVVDNLLTNGSLNDETEMSTIGWQNDNSDEMGTNCSQNDEVETIEVQILPTSERQVRPLTKLEPSQQREAWLKSVAQAGGRVPSGRIVKSIVEQIQERKKVPNPWKVGDVAKIVVKDDPQLRGKAGCLAIVTAVGDFSLTVRVWNGEYQLKPANLKDLCYSDTEQEAVRSLCDRLTALYDAEIEDTAKVILATLGKVQRPWLTELEQGLLQFLEGNFN